MTEWQQQKGSLILSTDRNRLDMDFVYAYLSAESPWARGIPRATVEASVKNSLCFGIYEPPAQLAFARAITDRATFAYIDDVFVRASHQGRGLGRWLAQSILECPHLVGIKSWWLLAGSEAAWQLFESVGFRRPEPERLERWMTLPGGSRGFYMSTENTR